jgi:hypothetical protein
MRKDYALHHFPDALWLNDKHEHIIACYVLEIETREYL